MKKEHPADRFPPRGRADKKGETPPLGEWLSGSDLVGDDWGYEPGRLLLGHDAGRWIGFDDNRHIVTIAGSRSGKTRSLLMPNLVTYPGSCVVIDPKGELAEMTARYREDMGQDVYILNPFRDEETSRLPPSHCHNPLAELHHATPENLGADVAQLADALIIGNDKDPHWTDSAKNVIVGIILYCLKYEPEMLTLRGLRTILSDDDFLKSTWEIQANDDNAGRAEFNIAKTLLGKVSRNAKGEAADFSGELQSILSTAREQTRPLDDVAHITDASDFELHRIGQDRPVTIYLVLPGLRIATHARWLRLFVYQLLAALERDPIEGLYRLRLVLEEFAALGNIQAIETAAGYMAGAGCQLWTVLQDLNQLQTHYEKSWQTFLGNAGIITAFGVIDMTTTDYLSKLIGNTTILERREHRINSNAIKGGDPGHDAAPRSMPLLEPAEISRHFARETGRMLVSIPGKKPIYLERFLHDRHPNIYLQPHS